MGSILKYNKTMTVSHQDLPHFGHPETNNFYQHSGVMQNCLFVTGYLKNWLMHHSGA
jgi:hypothetical protein